ncbi:MAG: hypothetical protein P9M03_03690, partial [Candidatus Theseobacter exili]|nr:hypothetical protein [Candidatus Theseobacter exili]
NEKRLEALTIRDRTFLESKDGRLYAEPSVLCGLDTWVLRTRYSWSGSVHAKCEVEYFKSFFPGTFITATGKIIDQYEKRGGRYFVSEVNTRDEHGNILCRVRNTMLLNLKELLEYKKTMVKSKKNNSGKKNENKEENKSEVCLSFEQKELTMDNILLFWEIEESIYGSYPCIHNTVRLAKEAGLADIVAPGRYSIGLLNAMFGNIWGELWLQRGKYEVYFLNNLLPGVLPKVTAEAMMGNTDGSSDKKKVFNVVCRDNASNKHLLAGRASVYI